MGRPSGDRPKTCRADVFESSAPPMRASASFTVRWESSDMVRATMCREPGDVPSVVEMRPARRRYRDRRRA